MDNLVINTDFKGELFLPVLNLELANDLFDFNTFVAEKQEYYLRKLLGYQLYSEFDAAIVGGSPEQKWIDLRDGADFTGKDFTGNDITLHWNGLAEMLKYLIFGDYIENQKFTVSDTGLKSIDTDTTQNINITPTQIFTRYNKGVELYGNEIIGFNDNITGHIDSRYLRNLSQNYSPLYKELLIESLMIPSAFNFIFRNSANYDNWFFTQIETKKHL